MQAESPPRVVEFENWLRTSIPILKDDASARSELGKMRLPELLMAYLNWADRFIQLRKRELLRHNLFWDEKAIKNEKVILEIASDLARGNDVNKRISRYARTYGFVSSDYKKSDRRARWLERDLYLNGHDTHHLHLGENASKRSSDLLFLGVGRDTVTLIMVGGHKSFDDGLLGQRIAEIRSNKLEMRGITPPTDESIEDRAMFERLGFVSTYVVDDKVVLGAIQSVGGASLGHVRFADKLSLLIEHYEDELNRNDLVTRWFKEADMPPPSEPLMMWRMQGCDLVLVETSKSVGFTPTEGKWCR